jgi:hypothetical protein
LLLLESDTNVLLVSLLVSFSKVLIYYSKKGKTALKATLKKCGTPLFVRRNTPSFFDRQPQRSTNWLIYLRSI